MKGTLNMDISNMNNIESRVQSYWTKRAHNFNIVRKNELNSSISERWREEIVHFLPEGKVLQILDVGTGTGYFAILLSQSGHQVTGIDLTDAMLKEARDNAALYQVHPTFQQMDAQKLAFLDQSFDVVISRNLTWTLPDAEHAYQEWFRVLNPGGVMMILDAKRLDYMTFPRLVAVAESAWTPAKSKECSLFMQKLPYFLQFLGEKGIYYFNPFNPESTPEPSAPDKDDVLKNG